MKTLKDGIFKYNPIFGLCLGLCSTLAVSYNVENALIMGISVTIVLLLSNFVISLIGKFVDAQIRVPAFIMIIATLVTVLELLLKAYAPLVYATLGIYIPLITVNCIVLGRALSFAMKSSPSQSILDAIGSGLGYTLAIVLIAIVRELLGSNSLTIISNLKSLFGFQFVIRDIIPGGIVPMSLFVTPAGAFLTLGFLLVMIRVIKEKVGAKK